MRLQVSLEILFTMAISLMLLALMLSQASFAGSRALSVSASINNSAISAGRSFSSISALCPRCAIWVRN